MKSQIDYECYLFTWRKIDNKKIDILDISKLNSSEYEEQQTNNIGEVIYISKEYIIIDKNKELKVASRWIPLDTEHYEEEFFYSPDWTKDNDNLFYIKNMHDINNYHELLHIRPNSAIYANQCLYIDNSGLFCYQI